MDGAPRIPTEAYATIGLSIVGLVFVPVIPSVFALWMGRKAAALIASDSQRYTGAGMVLAARVLAALSIILWIALLVAWLTMWHDVTSSMDDIGNIR